MKLNDLLDLAGDDLRWHPLMANVTRVQAGREANTVTFKTPYVTPNDAVDPSRSEFIALVIYLPRSKVPEHLR